MATSITLLSATPTSITVRVKGWPSGTGYIRFYIGETTSDMPYCGYVDVRDMSSCTFTFSYVPYSQTDAYNGYPLEPDTGYYLKVSPRAATSGQEAMESATTVLFYTEPEEVEEPTLYIRTFTSTSGGVTLNVEVDAPSGNYYVVFKISYLGKEQTHTSSRFTSTTGLTWPFYNIPSNTQVKGYVYLYDYNTDELYDSASATVTTLAPIRPDDWSWTSNVTKGAALPYVQTGEKSYTVKPLTAKEWNNFIGRIFDFMAYKEITYSGDTSGFYVTAGTEMEADTVDLARQLIAVMNPPTALPSAIRSGGKITAAYINGLKNSLNSIE